MHNCLYELFVCAGVCVCTSVLPGCTASPLGSGTRSIRRRRWLRPSRRRIAPADQRRRTSLRSFVPSSSWRVERIVLEPDRKLRQVPREFEYGQKWSRALVARGRSSARSSAFRKATNPLLLGPVRHPFPPSTSYVCHVTAGVDFNSTLFLEGIWLWLWLRLPDTKVNVRSVNSLRFFNDFRPIRRYVYQNVPQIIPLIDFGI